MPQAPDTPTTIVSDELYAAASAVIEHVLRNTPHPLLVQGRLGDTDHQPQPYHLLTSEQGTPPATISQRWAKIVKSLAQTDQQHGQPLEQIAQNANAVMAAAAMINRHTRRPTLYREHNISMFVQLNRATPEHARLIRAAGYVAPPPTVPLSHNIDFVIADVAAHMARSHQPQSTTDIWRSLEHRQAALDKWPHLDLALFIQRTADIRPDGQGLFDPDQPWHRHLSTYQLVAKTVLRILDREQRPCTNEYLVGEIERLVGHTLPPGYDTARALRSATHYANEISWQGRSTYILQRWADNTTPIKFATSRRRTGDIIYAFLIEHGPAQPNDIIEHVQRNSIVVKDTILNAIKYDSANQFFRIDDGRVAANPFTPMRNSDTGEPTVVPDGQRHRLGPILHESELRWLTRYLQNLNELAPPLPARVALTGPRAVGLALEDNMEITVVVHDHDRTSLETRLVEIAAAASAAAPSVQPSINIATPQEWDCQQGRETFGTHHDLWLAPRTAP